MPKHPLNINIPVTKISYSRNTPNLLINDLHVPPCQKNNSPNYQNSCCLLHCKLKRKPKPQKSRRWIIIIKKKQQASIVSRSCSLPHECRYLYCISCSVFRTFHFLEHTLCVSFLYLFFTTSHTSQDQDMMARGFVRIHGTSATTGVRKAPRYHGFSVDSFSSLSVQANVCWSVSFRLTCN